MGSGKSETQLNDSTTTKQHNPSSTLHCDGGQGALPLKTPISPSGSLEFWQPFKGLFFLFFVFFNIFIFTFLSLFS